VTPRSDYQLEMRLAPDEIIVDSFAGGGGASLGIQWALGRGPHIAINHDKEAIALHAANHPESEHYPEDVWHVDPVVACAGRKVGLMWLSPDCFPAGTLVLTRGGYRPIETVRVGDEVFTHRARWRKVTELGRAVKPIMHVRGHGHPGLAVTPEHPFYARQHQRHAPSWLPASALSRGWYWASPTTFAEQPIPLVSVARQLDITPDLMWLVGRYLGDGWTRLTATRAELVITCGPSEIDELRPLLNRWPRAGARGGPNELAWHERRTTTAYQFTTDHRGLVEWLRTHFGHRAEAKLLPTWAFGMAIELREALLAGYLSADGYDSGLFVECTTVSRALAFSIKTLAQTLGKTVGVYRGANSTEIQGRTVNARPVYRLRWRHQIDKAHEQTWRTESLEWSPVRESVSTGETAEVYNIGVEDDESYVVESIVVHNCKHFSKAKGGKPVSKKIRGLAWTACRWAKAVRPRVIVLENVEEFQEWGPLIKVDGKWKPDPTKKGHTFSRFVARLRRLGYVVEWRTLRASHYATPTIRKRFFLIARCDGRPIAWPQPTHGKGLAAPLTAATIIDWSIPCPSIFTRKKALAENTQRRIARGIQRYVVDSPKPFIVQYYSAKRDGDHRIGSIDAPLGTQPTENKFGIVTPIIAGVGGRAGQSPERPLDKPYQTITAKADAAIVAAHLTKFHSGSTGSELTEPAPTITSNGFQKRPGGAAPIGLVSGILVPTTHEGDARAHSLDEPTRTITGANRGEHALISPTLVHFKSDAPSSVGDPMPTQTSRDCFGLVAPFLKPRFGEREGQEPRVRALDIPAPTIVPTGNGGDLVAAFLAKHYGGHETPGSSLADPTSTITTQDHHHLVSAHIAKHYGDRVGSDLNDPLHTVTAESVHHALVASSLLNLHGTSDSHLSGRSMDEPMTTIAAGGMHAAEVRAFLISYYGTDQASGDLNAPTPTVTSKDRLGLVTISGIEYQIVDIGMRMLQPRELYRAQGFPDSYKIAIPFDYVTKSKKTGKTKVVRKPLTKTAQVRMAGNSVCPPLAAAIISANLLGETFAAVAKERVA
jgi:site-specific DNA-cytosine methylase